MIVLRSLWRPLPLSAVLLLAAAPVVSAQDRQLFVWTGRVDREVRIAMRGRNVWTEASRTDDGRNRAEVSSALPRNDGYVRVRTLDGRGDVDVVQQPNVRNDYTTIVRVVDRSSGSDRYRVSAFWQPGYSDDRGGWRRDGDHDGYPPRVEPRDRDGGWSRDGGNGGNGGYGGYGGSGSYSHTVLHWSGAVDTEEEIRIQGRRADSRALGGSGSRDVRSDMQGGLPQRDMQLVINQRQGRGQVFVVQQPSAWNGYTAVIRVRDPQGGFGFYDFDVDWR
jgi:hypothetical protein